MLLYKIVYLKYTDLFYFVYFKYTIETLFACTKVLEMGERVVGFRVNSSRAALRSELSWTYCRKSMRVDNE